MSKQVWDEFSKVFSGIPCVENIAKINSSHPNFEVCVSHDQNMHVEEHIDSSMYSNSKSTNTRRQPDRYPPHIPSIS